MNLKEILYRVSIQQAFGKIDENVLSISFDSNKLKANLISQLTAPVYWTQTIKQMILDGATHFTEVGPGKVLQGLVKKIDNSIETESGY